MRWPKGPPHLALKPSLFICVSFVFLVFVERKTVSPRQNRTFFASFLSVSLGFSVGFLQPPPSNSLSKKKKKIYIYIYML